ncbi:MAG: glycosyltransferase [Dehalococcoidia bacterium]|nr:glycosyltransferase [Dehalococcoidia bacterium]
MDKEISEPQISVIVVTKNEEKNISACLESLIAQDYPKDRYEIIVVDGASTDKTQEICRRYPITLIIAERSGISHQRNAGIQVARGSYIAFTDADCVAERAWLRKLIEQIESSDKSVVAVGGPNLVFDDDPLLSKTIGYTQETLLGSGGSPQCCRISKPSFVYSIPNCNILYRKQIIAEERYDDNFSIGEDAELNFRLRQKGYRFLYLPGVIVWHHRPGTIKDFAKKMFHYGEAMARITRKHKKIIRWYAFVASLAVLAVIFSYPIVYFFRPFIYIYAVATLIYIIALAISTTQVYRKCKSISSILTMILLPIQHFVYGLGFLKGLLEPRKAT